MAPKIYPAYPPQVTPAQCHFLTAVTKEWAICHGLAVTPASSPNRDDVVDTLATTAPVTLFPSLFPLNCYHEALMIQTAYNEMYSSISRDEKWLADVVKE